MRRPPDSRRWPDPATAASPSPHQSLGTTDQPLSSLSASPSGPHDQPSPAATPVAATTAAPISALTSGRPRISLSAVPFYPSGGRGKELRWADVSPASVGSPCRTAVSYRDVLLRASPPPVPQPAAAPRSFMTASGRV